MSGDTEGRCSAPEHLRETPACPDSSPQELSAGPECSLTTITTGCDRPETPSVKVRVKCCEPLRTDSGVKCREPLKTDSRSRVAQRDIVNSRSGAAGVVGGVDLVCGDAGPQNFIARTIDGCSIELKTVSHDGGLCREFIINTPTLNFKVWFGSALFIYVIAYALHLHTWDSRIMASVVIVLTLALAVKLNFKVKKESLLVMTAIGAQLTTTFASGRSKSTFYDISHINGIIINEAITMHRVIYYMSLMIDRSGSHDDVSRMLIGPTQSHAEVSRVTSLVPLFTHSWPSLSCLRRIYSDATNTLQLNYKNIN